MSSTGPVEDNYDTVYEAAKRIIEESGTRHPGEATLSYAEGDLEVRRTSVDEYEVEHAGAVVFRCRHNGARSGAHVFKPGEWMARLMRVGRSPGGPPEGEGLERR